MGAKFRTRLVLYFLSAVLIPSVLLFIVASGLLTSVLKAGLIYRLKNP